MVIYLSGPLESKAEKTFMAALAKDLENAGHTLSWPGALFLADDIAEMGHTAPRVVLDSCNAALKRCACMVVVMDGARVESGTAWEVGYAHANGVPVFGLLAETLRSDGAPPTMGNSVVHGCLEGRAPDIPALIRMLSDAGGSRALANEAGKRG